MISEGCRRLNKLTIKNFKSLKVVQCSAPTLQKFRLFNCQEQKVVEIKNTRELLEIQVLDLTLDQNSLLQVPRERILQQLHSDTEDAPLLDSLPVYPVYLLHEFQPKLAKITVRAWLGQENQANFFWSRHLNQQLKFARMRAEISRQRMADTVAQ